MNWNFNFAIYTLYAIFIILHYHFASMPYYLLLCTRDFYRNRINVASIPSSILY
jgi:hypothetical protein